MAAKLRIPGPAGIMQDIMASNPAWSKQQMKDEFEKRHAANDDQALGTLSRGAGTKGDFVFPSWQLAVRTLGISLDGWPWYIMNILDTDKRVFKAGHYLGYVTSMTFLEEGYAEAVLKDPTGSIKVLINKDVMSDKSMHDFRPGATVALNNPTVTCFAPGEEALMIGLPHVHKVFPAPIVALETGAQNPTLEPLLQPTGPPPQRKAPHTQQGNLGGAGALPDAAGTAHGVPGLGRPAVQPQQLLALPAPPPAPPPAHQQAPAQSPAFSASQQLLPERMAEMPPPPPRPSAPRARQGVGAQQASPQPAGSSQQHTQRQAAAKPQHMPAAVPGLGPLRAAPHAPTGTAPMLNVEDEEDEGEALFNTLDLIESSQWYTTGTQQPVAGAAAMPPKTATQQPGPSAAAKPRVAGPRANGPLQRHLPSAPSGTAAMETQQPLAAQLPLHGMPMATQAIADQFSILSGVPATMPPPGVQQLGSARQAGGSKRTRAEDGSNGQDNQPKQQAVGTPNASSPSNTQTTSVPATQLPSQQLQPTGSRPGPGQSKSPNGQQRSLLSGLKLPTGRMSPGSTTTASGTPATEAQHVHMGPPAPRPLRCPDAPTSHQAAASSTQGRLSSHAAAGTQPVRSALQQLPPLQQLQPLAPLQQQQQPALMKPPMLHGLLGPPPGGRVGMPAVGLPGNASFGRLLGMGPMGASLCDDEDEEEL